MNSIGDGFLIGFEDKAGVEQRTSVGVKRIRNAEEHYSTFFKEVAK